ncbi:MAG TPA: D-aminoacyl-tRNA deacylase [Opitutaceae bacterium]|nr:D-aminoacyl-tRNA deacylase [Opitutaceae bacterium]
MRAVIQRVASAAVSAGGEESGRIGPGLLVLVGIARDDTAEDGAWLAQKIVKLRIFPDGDGQMNRAVTEAGGEILVVSQFTLHASVRKGSRPSYNDAAKPEQAVPLYEDFVRQLQAAMGRPVATGRFGALMQVSLVNDGPVTILIDTKGRE